MQPVPQGATGAQVPRGTTGATGSVGAAGSRAEPLHRQSYRCGWRGGRNGSCRRNRSAGHPGEYRSSWLHRTTGIQGGQGIRGVTGAAATGQAGPTGSLGQVTPYAGGTTRGVGDVVFYQRLDLSEFSCGQCRTHPDERSTVDPDCTTGRTGSRRLYGCSRGDRSGIDRTRPNGPSGHYRSTGHSENTGATGPPGRQA